VEEEDEAIELLGKMILEAICCPERGWHIVLDSAVFS
jgi:hypothetical protein